MEMNENMSAWVESVRLHCGKYCVANASELFQGWVRPGSICGFDALDLATNVGKLERTQRDARQDRVDHYYALVQVSGRSVLVQDDDAVKLDVGDVALVDSLRATTYTCDQGASRWLGLRLPRQAVAIHVGVTPNGALSRPRSAPAAQLLSHLVSDTAKAASLSLEASDPYMQLAVYGLLASLFSSDDPSSRSHRTDPLFSRIRATIQRSFTDPNVGPSEIAAEAGISLRYLQKLFTMRGRTCSDYILSLRLEYAARLIRQRAVVGSERPLYEVGYASGFQDYNYFARAFRRRFGRSPGAALIPADESGHDTVRGSMVGRAS
jgi:AraC family transcriptional activator of tynA and feaB